MKIYLNKKPINIQAKKLSPLGKISGLMFKSPSTENLLFQFKKPSRRAIHSFFVSFPFLAVWLDYENKVLDYKIVHPWKLTIKPKNQFTKLIELPINKNNQKILKFFVDRGKV